jgi:arylsulfatase A-like enzyme
MPAHEQNETDSGLNSAAPSGRLPEWIATSVSVALVAGSLNVAVSLYLERPPELALVPVVVEVVGLSVLFSLLLYALAWTGLAVGSFLLSRFSALLPDRVSRSAHAAATSLAVMALGILTPFVLLADRGGWQQDLVRFGFLGCATLIAAGLGLPLGKHWASSSVRTFLMAAPVLGASILLATWANAFAVDSSGAESFLLWLAVVTMTVVALGTCFALLARISLVSFIAASSVVMIVVGAFIAWQASTPPELQMFDARAGARPRHVILLTVDTLRADALGPVSGGPSDTPNIDALATDSVVFDNARSPAPWTKPAVVSILTGLSPVVHEIMRGPTLVPDELATLPEFLQGAGYRTGAVGENPFLHARYNFDQGFDRYRMFPKMLGRSFGGRLVRYLGMAFPSTSDLTDIAIEWIDANADDPFFLWLHYFDPHPPYAPPAAYLTRSGPPSIGNSFGDTSGVRAGAVNLDGAERDWVEELYLAEVQYVDDNVGRFLDHLRESGVYDDSLIIFSSDHGEEFWEHGGFEHGHSLYDEVIKVPLMIKLPGQRETGSRRAHVSTESIMPTILDLLELEAEDAAFSAASLAWAWEPDRAEPMTPVISTGLRYFEDRIAVIFRDMKQIHWLVSGRDQLFDLDQDPGETSSIADANPELIDEAQNLVTRHEALSLQIRQLLGLPTTGEGVLDPALLEQLRALGYIQ